MRQAQNPRTRIAVLSLCSISIALALITFGLAFSVASPSRTFRPVITSIDSMYTPMYISMTAAGLLILASLVGIASCFYGNRALDLSVCIVLLSVVILSLTSLGLMVSVKSSTESSMETKLEASLAVYGPSSIEVYQAWDYLQTDLACCAVRTNKAEEAYQKTPWYLQLREGNPHAAPKIPNSCCTKLAIENPSQVADCTINLPSLPAMNSYMNSVGCFEAAMLMTEVYSVRFIIVSVILLIASAATLAATIYNLVLLTRHLTDGGDKLSMAKSQSKFSNGYDNPTASIGLSQASLAPSSDAASGASAAQRVGRSQGQSVYGGSQRLSSKPPSVATASNSPAPTIDSRQHQASRSLAGSGGQQSNSGKATTTSAAVLTAQPIRSRGGPQRLLPQPVSANRRAPQPLANQRAPTMPTNQRAPTMPANQRAQTIPANQKAPQTPPNQRAPTVAPSSIGVAANGQLPHHQQPIPYQQTLLTPTGKRESHF